MKMVKNMYLKYVLIVFFLFSGPGDGFFSSAFQSTLQGNVLYKNVVPAGIWITYFWMYRLAEVFILKFQSFSQ